jgi:outer membrane receptor for ferrienterochelin and colicins
VQYIFNVNEKTSLEAGLRVDYNTTYKVYPLPHIAIRHKWNETFLTRLNVGMGYKLPTIFQDEAEEARYMNLQKITASVKPELSVGGTLDLRIKLPNFDGLNISLHQLYFITQIFKPIVSETKTDTGCLTLDCEQLFFKNGTGFYRSGGVETGLTATYRGFDFSFVYTLTDNNRRIDGVRSIAPLTSKHIVYMLAGYAFKNFSFGVDVYYYSPVKLSDGRMGKPIWEVGVNAQYDFKYLLLFANFENIANIRQTSFGPTVFPNPTYAHPRFSEIYAPLEGRLLNVGFQTASGYVCKKEKRRLVQLLQLASYIQRISQSVAH